MVVTTMTNWNITISLVELTDLVKSVQFCWTFNQLKGGHKKMSPMVRVDFLTL